MTGEHGAKVHEVRATQIEPGDHLPPQRALHGTRWQEQGFTVGTSEKDVRADLPVLPGKVLLFSPAGALNAISRDSVVTVRRAAGHSAH